jgi:hypothetical protein
MPSTQRWPGATSTRRLDRLTPIAASIAATGRSRAQSETDERHERLAKARTGASSNS